MQQGTYAAEAIVRKATGEPKPAPFSYFDKVTSRSLDEQQRSQMVEFQSRIVVFVRWAIQDVTFSRGSRLITGVAPTDFNFNHAVAGERSAVEPTAEKKSETAVA